MNAHKASVLGWMVLVALIMAPTHLGHTAETNPPPAWANKMRELYSTLSELLTDVSSDRRFNDPSNYSGIEAKAKKLATLSHDLTEKKMIAPDADPTLQMLSGLFSREANRAYEELKKGHRPYARNLLQSISGYCIACHTRNQTGPNFKELPLEPGSAVSDHFERGTFYMASRQFDRAQEELSKVIEDHKFATSRPLAWERSIQHYLNIAVRIKQSPSQALEIVNKVIDTQEAPYFLKQTALQWKSSIQEWQNEPKKTLPSEEGLYSEATRLAAKGHELQKYPMDRSGDIYYLRASAVVHDLLKLAPNGNRAAEALLLAGVSYEVLSPLRLDDLHEIYYGACVEKAPHTPVAQLCYQRYQQSVYAGYTGSGGENIPSEVKSHLLKIEELARPKELDPKAGQSAS